MQHDSSEFLVLLGFARIIEDDPLEGRGRETVLDLLKTLELDAVREEAEHRVETLSLEDDSGSFNR